MKKECLQENIAQDEHFVLRDIFGLDVRPFTELHRFAAEEDILREGERPNYLYYLVSGRAKLYLTHDNGRITLINFLGAPCFLGEMELLDEEKYSDGVKAITECVCYAIRINECRERLLNDTEFLRYLCRFLSRKAVGNTANYSRNQSYPLKNRMASFILETAVNGMYRERHTEVAEYLGVTYRHLLYVIAELVQDGTLIKTESGYRIADLGKLKRLFIDFN
ncbi:MAG: transcriptional regulator YeiL [Lachnospiraceae bacterium]|nr:transcriptional regulator YeiL [Lachnospiraceae bacterium]